MTAFLDALVAAAHDGQVVLALRADFYGRCAAHERPRAAGRRQPRARRPDAPRRAAARDRVSRRERAGLTVEPALTDALIADVLDAPGGLPLLSAALLEQWRERDGRVLRRASYERTGGVRGAVGPLAEQTYAQPERARAARPARRMLLRLATATARRSCAAASRSRSSAGRRAALDRARRQPARDRRRRTRSRSRTRRCCASGRACARGSTTTPRAAGCTST